MNIYCMECTCTPRHTQHTYRYHWYMLIGTDQSTDCYIEKEKMGNTILSSAQLILLTKNIYLESKPQLLGDDQE